MSRHSRIFRSRCTAPIIITNTSLDSSCCLPQTPRPEFSNFVNGGMSRHSRIFRSRCTDPIIITNTSLDSSCRLPQTPRPKFSSFIHDPPEPVAPCSPGLTYGALGSSQRQLPPSGPVSVRAAFIEFGQVITFCYVFCLITGLSFFLWVATLGTVRFQCTVSDEYDDGHVAGACSVPLPVTRTRSSRSSAASDSPSVYSFHAPLSPGVAIALPQSLLDQILVDGHSIPTVPGLPGASSVEGASPLRWDDSATDVEPSMRARGLSASNPYFYSSSSSPSTSVGSRDPTDSLSALADLIAQRIVEERLAELETPHQLRSGNGS